MNFNDMFQELVPPFIFRRVRKIVKNLRTNSPRIPEWKEIRGGPAKGCWIYVMTNMPAFKNMIEGSYDNYFWEYLRKINLKDQTILDIGGHIGYHSLCFSSLCGKDGKVYVFEPNIYNLERMKLIFQRNRSRTENIFVCNKALGNVQGEVSFNFSKNVDNQTSSGSYLDGSYKPLNDNVYDRLGFTSVKVETDTLDNFLKAKNISKVSCIKIDVEGAEHLVLQGGIKTISSHRPLLLIEIHSVSAMLYVCQILFSANYQIEILEEDRISRCFIAAIP